MYNLMDSSNYSCAGSVAGVASLVFSLSLSIPSNSTSNTNVDAGVIVALSPWLGKL